MRTILEGLILMVLAPAVMAAPNDLTVTSGTATLAITTIDANTHVYRFTCVSDAPGSLTLTTVNPIYGTITRVTTNPADGATSPTDNWDLVINDEDGFDVLGGGGANRDAATTESFVPTLAGSIADSYSLVTIGGVLSFVGNGIGAANGFDVIIHVRK